MKAEKVFSEMKEMEPRFKKILNDDVAAEKFADWWDGFLFRDDIEASKKKRRKRNDKS